jgi:hypothetical protein
MNSELLRLDPGPLKSVGTIMAQRRLQERFCARFAECLHGDWGSESAAGAAAFTSCLRNETLEQYDGVLHLHVPCHRSRIEEDDLRRGVRHS